MPYTPLGNNCIIKIIESTNGSIIIPDAVKDARGVVKVYGKVCAVGNGKLLRNGQRAMCAVPVGATVLVNHYPSHDVALDDGTFIINEENIIGIVVE